MSSTMRSKYQKGVGWRRLIAVKDAAAFTRVAYHHLYIYMYVCVCTAVIIYTVVRVYIQEKTGRVLTQGCAAPPPSSFAVKGEDLFYRYRCPGEAVGVAHLMDP